MQWKQLFYNALNKLLDNLVSTKVWAMALGFFALMKGFMGETSFVGILIAFMGGKIGEYIFHKRD